MNVPCPVCGTPLDKALPAAGFTTHPDCDPREISAQWPPETAGDPAALPRARAYRILVTGSRDWDDEAAVRAELGEEIQKALALSMRPVVVHGACPDGADAHAARLCADLAAVVTEEPHPADWARHGKAAGFLRNAEMARLGAIICLAFAMPCQFGPPHCNDPHPHDTHGTRDCTRAARKAGIPVTRITPESCRLRETAPNGQEMTS